MYCVCADGYARHVLLTTRTLSIFRFRNFRYCGSGATTLTMLLPTNIIAKHDGQAMVARRELQNWHKGASVELAAPQLGQFSVSACIVLILAVS